VNAPEPEAEALAITRWSLNWSSQNSRPVPGSYWVTWSQQNPDPNSEYGSR